MDWFKNLKIKMKLTVAFSILVLLTGFVGIVGYISLDKVDNISTKLYSETTVPLAILQRLTSSYGVIRIRIREMFTAKNENELSTFSKSITKEIDSIATLSKMYETTFIDDTDRKNWGEFKDAYDKYIEHINLLTGMLKSGSKDEALNLMNTAGKPLAVESRNRLDKVVEYNIETAEKYNNGILAKSSKANSIMLIAIITAVLLAIGLGVVISKMISEPINLVCERLESLDRICLNNLQNGAEEFASGNLNVKIKTGTEKLDIYTEDETGQLAQTLNKIIDKTVASIHAVEKVTGTVVLITEEINGVVDSAIQGKLSKRGNPDCFKGGFKEIIIGLNKTLDAIVNPLNTAAEFIDRISKGDIPNKITEKYNGDFNELKNNLNTCIEAVNMIIIDARLLSQAAVEGKLSVRADASKHFGDFRKIIEGVNGTLDSVINPLNFAALNIARISKGDIPEKITDEYKGDFNNIKNNLNTCFDSLNSLVKAMVNNTEMQKAGDIEAFADDTKFEGVYQKLISGYNLGMKIHIDTIMDMLKLIGRYSEGNLKDIMPELPGKQVIATERINLLRQNILNLIADTNILAQAAVEGKFSARADAEKHKGDFKKIIEGVNNTLDNLLAPINVAADCMNKISKGIPLEPISEDYKGDFNGIKNSINALVDTTSIIYRGIGRIARSVKKGDLVDRGKAQLVEGNWKVLVEDINTILNSLIDQVHFMGDRINDIAKGEIPEEITEKYEGDYDVIKNDLNICFDSVKALIVDMNMLSNAAVEGKLSLRGDLRRHKGDFKKIIEGTNNTLDSLLAPIQEGISVLEKMALGDLTIRIDSEFKGDHQLIKNTINKVAGSLSKALGDVSEAIDATASASSQISSSTEQMAAGSQEQTQQTNEVASGVEEMTKTILENTKNVTLAAEAAKEAGDKAKEGGRVVSETIEGMNKISDVVKKSAETVQELGRSSDQIGEIVQVIDDIADQTNLLALNAAIEAARAGEQGRGFAVVADEVRKLAERTTKATKEIATMIKQIQKDTINAVHSMEEGTKEVDRGRELANRAGRSLNEIVDGSQKVLDIVAQVAAASEEQSSTAEEISKNVEAISSVASESSSGIQQIAHAAEDLNRLTLNLENLISQFKINISHTGKNISSKNSVHKLLQ